MFHLLIEAIDVISRLRGKHLRSELSILSANSPFVRPPHRALFSFFFFVISGGFDWGSNVGQMR